MGDDRLPGLRFPRSIYFHKEILEPQGYFIYVNRNGDDIKTLNGCDIEKWLRQDPNMIFFPEYSIAGSTEEDIIDALEITQDQHKINKLLNSVYINGSTLNNPLVIQWLNYYKELCNESPAEEPKSNLQVRQQKSNVQMEQQKSDLQVGNDITYTVKNTQRRGTIIKLNPKTARVRDVDGSEKNVAYDKLFPYK